MIEVSNLGFRYEGASEPALTDISFKVPAGSVLGLLGPSGAGKSTLQKVLTRLLPLQEGTVSYDGVPLHKLTRAFFNQVGVSFEHPNLLPRLTGRENLECFAGLFDGPTENPDTLLELVGLGPARNQKTSDYSKGMKQRLVFARALLHRPRYLFLDEPLSGLDPATGELIIDVIRKQRDRGVTVLVTTHHMALADVLCDQVAFIHRGRLLLLDTPRNLKLSHGQRSVRVEWRADGRMQSEICFLDKDGDRARLQSLLSRPDVETVHSQEASLEQIFIQLAGGPVA